jgi:ATP-dependent Lhr-like helicase
VTLDPTLDRIRRWFAARGWQPFPFQEAAWRAYLAGRSGLVHAATGTGKTYAVWLGPVIEALAEEGGRQAAGSDVADHRPLPIVRPPLRVLWVTPLRALAADTAAALQAPLDDLGLPWAVEARTGDTPPSVRRRQRERLPAALITTPESLSLLLSWPDAAARFAGLRAVIVDEWHELMGSKRGVQTELALARLRRWRPALRTWGLSATLGNLDEALATLLGNGAQHAACSVQPSEPSDHIPATSELRTQNVALIQGAADKKIQIDALIPPVIERFPWAGHLGLSLLPQVIATIEEGRNALVFTNTRAQAELWYQALLDARPDWAGAIALHHGSLDRATRDWVEAALRAGRLRCVVCTSSLDLGVDFQPVERVVQIGSPKGIGRLVQRAGRSGHRPGAPSRVVCAPTHAFELVEIAAARDAVARGQFEARPPLDAPLDVLVQHLVTVALGGGFRADELLAEVRTTRAYRDLSDAAWAWALEFAARGGPALRAYPEYARIVERDGVWTVASPAIARRHRMAIGTITSDATLRVQYLRGTELGTVEEAFVARLKPGDRFLFAGKVLEFVRLRDMTAWVRRADGRERVVPRWQGSRMPLSSELAGAVRARLAEARNGDFRGAEMHAVVPLLRVQARWSQIPSAEELLVERVRTREGFHLFVYPFEGRLAHEGLAALVAWRLSRLRPISFTIAVNDYGFELLSPDDPLPDAGQAPGDERLVSLFRSALAPDHAAEDILASLNATEMARRQFREIARVAGLVIQGFPGEKSARQLQVSSGLLYDVFSQYDPGNLLLAQARREVLERQLERTRLVRALARLSAGPIIIATPPRPTPLAFPLLVDRMREAVSSETLADRVRKMQLALEKAAGAR